MQYIDYALKRAVITILCIGFLSIQATCLCATLLYDDDQDCDVDGVDLYQLISHYNDDFMTVLPTFGITFGLVEPFCDTVGVGTPIDGYPNWHERTLMVFTNMVRMAPIQYRDTYMTTYIFPPDGILNDGFPPVASRCGRVFGMRQAVSVVVVRDRCQ